MSMIDILRADDAVTALLRGPQRGGTLVDPAAPGWLDPVPAVFGRREPTTRSGDGLGGSETDRRADDASPSLDDVAGRASTGATR